MFHEFKFRPETYSEMGRGQFGKRRHKRFTVSDFGNEGIQQAERGESEVELDKSVAISSE